MGNVYAILSATLPLPVQLVCGQALDAEQDQYGMNVGSNQKWRHNVQCKKCKCTRKITERNAEAQHLSYHTSHSCMVRS
jgi:hypothetical protein